MQTWVGSVLAASVSMRLDELSLVVLEEDLVFLMFSVVHIPSASSFELRGEGFDRDISELCVSESLFSLYNI